MRLRPATGLAFACTLAVVVASGALGASAARAAAGPVTFGPDLSTLAVNNTNDCTVDPLILWPGNPNTGAPSCTWSSSNPTNPNGGQIPPTGDGTISQVMVKVGAVTGPMQVVVMQAEFQQVDLPYIHYNISCCTDVGESAPFTPVANAITTEPVSLPVQVGNSDGSPGEYEADLLGLSVLEDGVPVPAADETTVSPENDQPGLDLEEPALQQNGQTQLADDGLGYLVAMDAVWQPAATSGSNPSPNPLPILTPSATPLFRFPTTGTLARVTGNHALIQAACGPGGAACDGKVSIQSARAASRSAHIAREAKAKVVTYATGSFALSAGKQQAVKAKLSGAGRTLASKHKSMKVWINVTLTGGSSPTVMSKQVTLRF